MEKKIDRRQKYDATHTRRYTIKLNLKTDANLIERLDNEPNVMGYLKRLIREDIMRGENEQ